MPVWHDEQQQRGIDEILRVCVCYDKAGRRRTQRREGKNEEEEKRNGRTHVRREKRMVRCLESMLIGCVFSSDNKKNECVVHTADDETILYERRNHYFPPQNYFAYSQVYINSSHPEDKSSWQPDVIDRYIYVLHCLFSFITMNTFRSFILVFVCLIPTTHANCIWYGGIRSSYNEVYLNGPPKPLPLQDVDLLNEMCPHIATPKGEFCCCVPTGLFDLVYVFFLPFKQVCRRIYAAIGRS